MKHIKLFEELNNSVIKVGDYVIVNSTYVDEEEIQNFFLNTIGKIILVEGGYIEVKYKYIPNYIPVDGSPAGNSWIFQLEEILYWSEDKKDLESIIAGNKYNL